MLLLLHMLYFYYVIKIFKMLIISCYGADAYAVELLLHICYIYFSYDVI